MQGGNSFDHDEKHENENQSLNEINTKDDYQGMNYNQKINDERQFSDEWIRKKDVKRKYRGFVGIGVIIVIIASFLSVYFINGLTIYIGKNGVKLNFGNELVKEEDENLSEIGERLELIYNKIHQYYDGEIDDEKVFDGAYKGMVEALGDPYSVYLNKKDYARLTQETSGSYVGLGITVGVIEDRVVVISPFKDSPADKAGLLPGDIINKVNNIEIGKDVDKAIGMMKGKEGGNVTLNIIREGTAPFDIDIIRAEIKLKTVRGEMVDENIGYIGLTMFSQTSSKDFKIKLEELKKEGAKGLILDLRGNPGGLVSACTGIASNFIPKGDTIVYTVDKYGKKYVYESEGGSAQDMPIVVLIDKGSASASEILSGALRDYQRATLIGEKSFGKGIVQTILSRTIDGFGDGTALKLTVSKYYTPNGENIHKKGIMPDLEVELDEETFKRGERETDSQYQKALEVIRGKIEE